MVKGRQHLRTVVTYFLNATSDSASQCPFSTEVLGCAEVMDTTEMVFVFL